MSKELKILLASPRGFCAGVDRAIEIVEKALKKFGAPVYVRHEIVHNKYVVDNLKKMGAIFIEELDEIKDQSRPVIFSAHGVPKSIPKYASLKKIEYIDQSSTSFLYGDKNDGAVLDRSRLYFQENKIYLESFI